MASPSPRRKVEVRFCCCCALCCCYRPWCLAVPHPGHPSVLFAEVVTQMGIEPMTTRCLVVALTTKLLGRSIPPPPSWGLSRVSE